MSLALLLAAPLLALVPGATLARSCAALPGTPLAAIASPFVVGTHRCAAVSRRSQPRMLKEIGGDDSPAVIPELEYPLTMDVKVIGNNEGPFAEDMLQLACECTGQKPEDVQVRWRDKGKYRSVTLRCYFENAQQVYNVYAAIDRDPRVKYKL